MSKSNYGDKMTSEEVNEHLKYLAKQKIESGSGPSKCTSLARVEAIENEIKASLLREKELRDEIERLAPKYLHGYIAGFNDCRNAAMQIVDEHEGYLDRIESLKAVKGE